MVPLSSLAFFVVIPFVFWLPSLRCRPRVVPFQASVSTSCADPAEFFFSESAEQPRKSNRVDTVGSSFLLGFFSCVVALLCLAVLFGSVRLLLAFEFFNQLCNVRFLVCARGGPVKFFLRKPHNTIWTIPLVLQSSFASIVVTRNLLAASAYSTFPPNVDYCVPESNCLRGKSLATDIFGTRTSIGASEAWML